MRNKLNTIEINQLSDEALESLQSIWFTADYHQGHHSIIKHTNRHELGFANIEEHDQWLLNDVHNKYIKKKDRVYILGDLSLAKRKEAEKFIMKMNGQKFLVLGNHDKNIHNSPQFSKIDKMMDFTYRQFDLDLHIVLCHYPMISWNKSVHGSWSLYGHVHGRTKHSYLGLDVGIDNDEVAQYRPINLLDVIEWMQAKEKKIGDNKIPS